MAANKVFWSAFDTFTDISATDQLKNLSAAGFVLLTNEIDNSNSYPYADFELLIKHGSAIAAGGYYSLYFLQALNGTDYEDTGAIPAKPSSVNIPLRAVTGSQKVTMGRLTIPNGKFKVMVVNNTSVGSTNVNGENKLSMRRYSDEIQAAA